MDSVDNFEIESESSETFPMINFDIKIQNNETTSINMQNIKKGKNHKENIQNEETKMTLNDQSQINQVFSLSKIENQEKNEEQISDNNRYFNKDKESKIVKEEKESKKPKLNIKKKRMKKVFLIKIGKSKKKFICKKIVIKEKETMKKGKKINEPSRQDNVRRMFVRIILNNYYYKKICKTIKIFRIKKLKKFPGLLIYKVSKIDNKNNMEKTLRDFYADIELNQKNYVVEKQYGYNLNIIKQLEEDRNKDIREKSGLEKLLNIKFKDLIEEFQNSNDYEMEKNEIRKKNVEFEAEKIIKFWDDFIENSKK